MVKASQFHAVPFNAERQAGKLWIPISIVFGLTRPRVETRVCFSSSRFIDSITDRQKNLLIKKIQTAIFYRIEFSDFIKF